MAKTGRAPNLRVVEPAGPITKFVIPVAVAFRINWDPPFDHKGGDLVAQGWALAYTRTAGLVVFISGANVVSGWLPAAHIRRLEP